MTISKTSQAYKQTETCVKELIEGQVISIDPSVGSSNSMPGWAVYRAGELIKSGTFLIPLSKSLPERLRFLGRMMVRLYEQYPPDVLIHEEIPAQRHGFGNAEAHASLLKALGVILSVPGPQHHVGIYPISWKNQVSENYVKSDEGDAIEIGQIVIDLAWTIKLDLPSKKRRKNDKQA